MMIVLDTNVLVAGIRSPAGASAELLRRVILRELTIVCSVPLFMEYEAVLLRPEHLLAAGVSEHDVLNVLNTLAGVVQRVDIRYLWRPCLRDANDDMVLETAVNGQASVIVSSNVRDFLPEIHHFGMTVQTPQQFLQGLAKSTSKGIQHGNP